MCLIIEQPAGRVVDDATIRGIYARNRQGFGFMRHDDDKGTLVARRYLVTDADHAVRLYRDVAGVRAVLHWRYATHGPTTLAMAHPFHVVDGLSVAHNGVIPGYGTRHESDTSEWVRTFLRPFLLSAGRSFLGGALDAVHDSDVQAELRKRIGRSVLCFMDRCGRIARVDAAGLGVTHDGVWYSNEYAWSAPKRAVWRSSDVAAYLRGPTDDRPASWTTARLARHDPIAGQRVDDYLERMRSTGKRTDVHPVNPFARVRRAPLASSTGA